MRANPHDSPNTVALDVIGDVHGEYTMLVRLLTTLGYQPDSESSENRNGAPIWSHPVRKAVFLGDLIDRGAESPQVLTLVRNMVEAGKAWSITGNHEFNAVGHNTPDGLGGWLRPRTPLKIGPHQSTIDQFASASEEWASHLEWFKSLPTTLDFGGLRIVHAAWHPESVKSLGKVGFWTNENLFSAYRDPEFTTARELVFNGPEVELPPGGHFYDHSRRRRTAVRIAWWETGGQNQWNNIVFPKGDPLSGLDSASSVPTPTAFYTADQPPVIFGHYALPRDAPAVQAPNVACIDFGCGKGGALGAYRWDGETVLDEGKVVRVYAENR